MNILHAQIRIFRPRASYGWLSLMLMGLVVAAFSIMPALAASLNSAGSLLTLVVCTPIAITFFLLALWFPTMRYELNNAELVLRYGPVITYRIPLARIQAIRRRCLGLTIWSCVRFPGVALFTAPYADVGNVKMCATAAMNDVLLIETPAGKYGITPANEEELVTAIQERMEI